MRCCLDNPAQGVEELLDDIEEGKLTSAQIEEQVVLTSKLRVSHCCNESSMFFSNVQQCCKQSEAPPVKSCT